MLCNGYEISGNLATDQGRCYEVYGADGGVIHECGSKRDAMDHAESLLTGASVEEPEPSDPEPDEAGDAPGDDESPEPVDTDTAEESSVE